MRRSPSSPASGSAADAAVDGGLELIMETVLTATQGVVHLLRRHPLIGTTALIAAGPDAGTLPF